MTEKNPDLSQLTIDDTYYLAAFHFAWNGEGIVGVIDWLKDKPFDKTRAKKFSQQTDLSDEISKLFFQACKYEYQEYPEKNKTEAEFCDEYQRHLLRQASRYLQVKDLVNGEDLRLGTAAVNYVNRNDPQQSINANYDTDYANEWRPEVYLKTALIRTLLCVIVIAGLLIVAFMLRYRWLQIVSVVIAVIGLCIIAGIPKRYSARKRLIAYLHQKGIDE